MTRSKIFRLMSSSASSPISSLYAGNLFSILNASIFCPPLGSRSMLA